MKIEDVYKGQSVGFTYKGVKHIGKVLDVQPEYVNGDLVYLATVETDVQDFEVNVARLLGVVK